jgi:hypothetical protein
MAASIAEVDANRTTKAERDLDQILNDKQELRSNEFWLLSFANRIDQRDFVNRLGQEGGIGLTAIYVCDNAGGITAFYGDQNVSPAEQINKARQETRTKVNADIVRAAPVADPSLPRARNEDRVIPENFSVCGAEIRATRAQMVALRGRLGKLLRAVELTNSRYRRFPIYSR